LSLTQQEPGHVERDKQYNVLIMDPF